MKEVFSVYKDDEDFEVKISKTDNGEEVELALAHLLLTINDYQKTQNEDFKIQAFMNKMKGWIEKLCEDQEINDQ